MLRKLDGVAPLSLTLPVLTQSLCKINAFDNPLLFNSMTIEPIIILFCEGKNMSKSQSPSFTCLSMKAL